MGGGGGTPAPDYKSTWESYSQWLLDARSDWKKSSAMARAKAAAAGVGQEGALKEVEKQLASTFSEQEKTARSGYTYKTLSANPKAIPIVSHAEAIGRMTGGTKTLSPMENFFIPKFPKLQVVAGARDEPSKSKMVMIPATNAWDTTPGQLKSAFTQFSKTYKRNPDIMELYYTTKYGLPGEPTGSPTEKEKALSRAKEAGGAGIRSRQTAASFTGGATSEDETGKSPWV